MVRGHFSAASASYALDQGDLEVVLRADVAGNQWKKCSVFERMITSSTLNIESSITKPVPSWLECLPDQTRSITANFAESFFLAPQPFYGGATTTLENRYEKLEFDDLDEQSVGFTQQGGWIAFLQHYFLSAWVPTGE